METGLLLLAEARPGASCGPRRFVELAVRGEELGFDAVWLGEQALPDGPLCAPPLVLAAAAERTRRIRLGAVVSGLGALDPLRTAEDTATLDVLSGGRAELVVAPLAPLAPDARHEDEERLQLLLALLADEDVHWQGRHRVPLHGVTVHPRPVQRPHPPVWIDATSAAAAERAARLGLPLLLTSASGRAGAELVALGARYRECYAEAGHDPARMRVGACSPGRGSPEQVLERFLALREALAPDLHLAAFDPGAGAEPPLADLDRFGARVLPALRAA